MAVVNTNISASIAQSALMKNDRALGKAMEQLSTGSRINSAADDAAGLAISTRMTSQINGLNVGIKNANDGISMLNTADGALVEVTNMLQRMRELALEASNGTTDTNDRTYLNKEYSQLLSEIERVATKTEWNGRAILNDTADGNTSGLVEFQIGVDTGTTLAVDFGDLTQATGTMVSLASSTIAASSTVSAQLVASSVIGKIDTAIDNVNLQRATLGAATNRLTHTVDNLTNVVVNAESTRSAIQDTDYAAATSELARSQIIAQAGTAMLAQANQMPQTVLALLQ